MILYVHVLLFESFLMPAGFGKGFPHDPHFVASTGLSTPQKKQWCRRIFFDSPVHFPHLMQQPQPISRPSFIQDANKPQTSYESTLCFIVQVNLKHNAKNAMRLDVIQSERSSLGDSQLSFHKCHCLHELLTGLAVHQIQVMNMIVSKIIFAFRSEVFSCLYYEPAL